MFLNGSIANQWHHRACLDQWLDSHANFSKVFLTGDSAGANIVHELGIRVSERTWIGLCLQGAILVHLYFSGEEAIRCELGAKAEVKGFNKAVNAIWSISLPQWAKRNHPFCNPFGLRSPALSSMVYPRLLVFAAGNDLLRDRGILYYESLKTTGKYVDFIMTKGENHVFHLFNLQSENVTLMLKSIS